MPIRAARVALKGVKRVFGRPPPSVNPPLPPQRRDKIGQGSTSILSRNILLARVKHNRRGSLVEFERLNPISRLSLHIDRLHFTTPPPPPFSYPSFLERSASCHHSPGRASLALRHMENSIRHSVLLFLLFCFFFFSRKAVLF